MTSPHAPDLKRLIRRLLEAWDAWLDADENFGREYEELNAATEALRRYLQEHES